jgi:hypothetical protein
MSRGDWRRADIQIAGIGGGGIEECGDVLPSPMSFEAAGDHSLRRGQVLGVKAPACVPSEK